MEIPDWVQVKEKHHRNRLGSQGLTIPKQLLNVHLFITSIKFLQ